MPAGRPTLYDPKYCQELIEHMERGLSYESFAGVVGVSKQTIYDWEKANQEFLDAKLIAVEKCRLFWEKKGIEGHWNASAWVFNMKNRFQWRDKQPEEVEKTVVNNIQVQGTELEDRLKQIKGEE